MQVILLERMGRLGGLGDKVSVRPGYARNYLIPQGKAVRATAENTAIFESRRVELEKHAIEVLQAAQARADAVRDLGVITIAGRAADEGRLYGSIGTLEITDAITKVGVTIHKSEICLPNGALRTIGEHDISLQLHSDITVHVKINVVPEA